MNETEITLRNIKDAIISNVGEMEEHISSAQKKQNYLRLVKIASELHKHADEMQNVLMKLRPRGI